MSFKYQLEASAPQQYQGGTKRTVTQQNVPSLKDLAICSLRIDPGCLRELHWHPNAGELGYCLQGQGTMGVFSPTGDNARFAIGVGSVSFVPKGYFHYIRNKAVDGLKVRASRQRICFLTLEIWHKSKGQYRRIENRLDIKSRTSENAGHISSAKAPSRRECKRFSTDQNQKVKSSQKSLLAPKPEQRPDTCL